MKKFFSLKSILTKLTFYVGCTSLAVFFAVSAIFIKILNDSAIENGKDHVNVTLGAISSQVESRVNKTIYALQSIKYLLDTVGFPAISENETGGSVIQKQFDALDTVYSIEVICRDVDTPEIVRSTAFRKNADGPEKTVRLAKEYKEYLDRDTPALSSPHFLTVNGEKRLFAIYSARARYNDRECTLLARLDLTELQEAARAAKPYGGGYVGLFSNDSTYVYYPITERIGTKMRDRPDSAARADALRDGKEFVRDNFLNSVTGNAAYSKLVPVHFATVAEPWGVQASISLSYVLSTTEHRTYQALCIISIGLLALLAGVFCLTHLLIRAPLRNIRDVAMGFSLGTFDKRLDVSSRDEIGSAAASLNTALDVVVEKMFWYESLLNALPNPIIVTNIDHALTFVNKAALQRLGLPEKDALAAAYAEWNKGLNRSGRRTDLSLPTCCRDSGLYTFAPTGESFSVRASCLLDTNKTPSGCVEVITDVTELVHLKEKAEEASRSKSDFLARMSHEIRTPMNAILGMIHLCAQTGLTDKQKNYLDKASSAAKSLLVVINDILDFSKIEAGKLEVEREDFALSGILQLVHDMMSIKADGKGIDFAITVAPDIPDLLHGGGSRLLQVLTNLCGNAIKFTEQGSVSLAVETLQQQGDALELRFTVKDTGVGIPRQKIAAIFDPFEQSEGSASRKFDGTGLGLAISKSLIEIMGGHIDVSSIEGVGSSFWFVLPLSLAKTSEKGEACAKEALENGNPIAGAEILLVEDNFINQEIAMELLQQFGATVTLAANGKEAVAMTDKRPYDLILMDIAMPEMDGITATEHIRASGAHNTATVPIIAMTAHALVGDREKSLAAGMNDHITKPIDAEALRKTITDWLAKTACESAGFTVSQHEGTTL